MFFPEIKKNFGFGCMRLPIKNGEVEIEAFKQMVDRFIESGFNYFDTAHGYLNGKSEGALKTALTSRYKREDYVLTNKLSRPFFNSNEEIRPLFLSQLDACGVDYFDFYLMHAQDRSSFEHFKRCRAYETAFELKNEGKIKHIGISFHDKHGMLEKILTEYPFIEAVQLQFNYLDYDSAAVESKLCYDVCRKFDKPVIVMEPVKGGNLVNLPKKAQIIFDELGTCSNAGLAIRFAAGFEGIFMVLSGMGSMEMVNDNISNMINFKPLDKRELEAIERVREVLNSQDVIPCTDCRYCTEGCPKKIFIPGLFECLNNKRIFSNDNAKSSYNNFYTSDGTRARDCIKCGACESACPQHLPIRKLLEEVSAEFDV